MWFSSRALSCVCACGCEQLLQAKLSKDQADVAGGTVTRYEPLGDYLPRYFMQRFGAKKLVAAKLKG